MNHKCTDHKCMKHDGGCLFICDVDNFKTLNDTKGHAEGGKVLKKLADIIREHAVDASITARLCIV